MRGLPPSLDGVLHSTAIDELDRVVAVAMVGGEGGTAKEKRVQI